MAKKITVFGSFVVDIMARCPHLPVPGETVKGGGFCMGPGGKGFNQAVAAHKAGVHVSMVTKVGNDGFSALLDQTMDQLGMGKEYIFRSEKGNTGCALIAVSEKEAQNQIVVAPGVCEHITDFEVSSLKELLAETDYLLVQLETNMDSVEGVLSLAYKAHAKLLVNPAPVQAIPEYLYSMIDVITPNEVEAEALTGISVTDEYHAGLASKWFLDRGVGQVVITMGKRGAFAADRKRQALIPAFEVCAVDTTGAGDAFNGGLAAALAEGRDLWEAAVFANAVAALSVQKPGTAPSMPEREEIDGFLKRCKDQKKTTEHQKRGERG